MWHGWRCESLWVSSRNMFESYPGKQHFFIESVNLTGVSVLSVAHQCVEIQNWPVKSGMIGKGELAQLIKHEREVCLKAREKLIAGRIKGWMQEWEGMAVVGEGENCTKDLILIGREFHGRGKELQKERPANLSMSTSCGRKRHTLPDDRILVVWLIVISR